MTEENLNSSLAIEDVSTPQTVSFNPESDAPEPPKGRSAIEQSLAEIEKVEGKIPEDPHGETLVPKDEKPKEEPKAKAEEKPKGERRPDGKFAPKQAEAVEGETVQQEQTDEPTEAPRVPKGERDITRPPDNFLPRAREKWAEAPEEVKSEFYRALENFEKGKTEYQEDRQFRKELRDFEDMAKSNGVTVRQALENYTAIDRTLRENPVEGLQRVFQSIGINPVEYAQYILGQQQQAQQDPVGTQNQQLQQQLARMQQEYQQMQQMTAQQQEQFKQEQLMRNVEQSIIMPFKAEHPRYDELADDIALFLNSGRIPSTLDAQQRLEEAYYMAERLNPAPHTGNVPNRSAQKQINPAGAKSIKGSLTNGTDVRSDKGQKLNPRDAIQAAMSQLGL